MSAAAATPHSGRKALAAIAIGLILVGIVVFAATQPGPYQKSTQNAAQQIAQNPTNNPLTSPCPYDYTCANGTSSGGTTGGTTGGGTGGTSSTTSGSTSTSPTRTGGSSLSGSCVSSGACYASVMKGDIGPWDVGVILVGVLILFAVVASLAKSKLSAAWKVGGIVIILVIGSIAIVAADSYIDSQVASFSFTGPNAPSGNGTGPTPNYTLQVAGSVIFSGTLGFTDGSTQSATGSAPLAATVYGGKQVQSLSLRVDMSATCTPSPCSFNITSGWATINQVLGASATPLRNVTYRRLAFRPQDSVNLYMQAFNGTQLATSMGALACGASAAPQRAFNYTVLGQFVLNVTSPHSSFQKTVTFVWPGLQLTQVGSVCSTHQPAALQQMLFMKKAEGFRQAYLRVSR